MIEFRQKCFTEYDAMRSLYTRILRDNMWRNRIRRIDKSALIPILKGNNVVIEKFVISKTFFGKDRYRLYLKLGAKVKLPDGIRLPGENLYKRVIGGKLEFNGAVYPGSNNKEQQTAHSTNLDIPGTCQKIFSKPKNGGDGGGKLISTRLEPNWEISRETTKPRGETLKYDMKERSLVLEFDSIEDALKSLDILPLGLDYNLYILD